MTALPKPEKREPKPRKRIPRGSRPRAFRKAPKLRITLKKLDDLARPLCHARGYCEAKSYILFGPAKGCTQQLQWAHIMSRTYKTSIRWARENCLCLCSAHHKFFTDRPAHWTRFLNFKIGASNVWDLEQRAIEEVRAKHDRTDTYAKLLYWRDSYPLNWTNPLVIA